MDAREEVASSLLGRSTVNRRKAAKAACKVEGDFCDVLQQALMMELETGHWETKAELVKALGELGCAGSETVLRGIVFSRDGSDHDLVKLRAAKSFVQVARRSLEDCGPVWEVIDAGGASITEGALEAVGYDRMMFDGATCRALIERCWDLGKERSRGYTDPRYGLAAACAGWNKADTGDFLRHCLESSDVPLRYVAEKSLQGKYVRLR